MKRVLVPVAEGFEEIETVTIVDILRRGGIDVTLAGIREGIIGGSRGIAIRPDTTLDRILGEKFDMVVLPGGQPGVNNLKADERILSLLRDRHASAEWIGAICAAPLALKEAGISEGRHLTSHPSVRSSLDNVDYDEGRVVCDGHLVTSRSPGTALEFAIRLVEILAGPEKANEISEAVLARTG